MTDRSKASSDRALGMNRKITRRDFLNGTALTIGAALLGSCRSNNQEQNIFIPGISSDYYPPALTGMRGNHDGSYELFHELRDGSLEASLDQAVDAGEQYDLVIVGAGISGLSAAHFYRKKHGEDRRILILDNHDDFGGHAKRNEFQHGNQTILGYGGTFSIDSPAPYSQTAKDLISELGIKVNDWPKTVNWDVYTSRGLSSGIFFDKETFGVDKLIKYPTGDFWGEEALNDLDESGWQKFLSDAPIHEKAKEDLIRLYINPTDFLPQLQPDQKKEQLARISYAEFLTKLVQAHEDVIKFFNARYHSLYGVGIEAIPAQDAWGLGLPGFQAMNLGSSFGRGMNHDAMRDPEGGEAYFFHFPDGNATIARLLVRKLIPTAIKANSVSDLINVRCDYTKLDQPQSKTRIRLNSTVVRVQNRDTEKRIRIDFAHSGKFYSVYAGNCILACWHSVIPYLCPDLPQQQKQDLLYEVKVPLVYTNVLLSNWHPFVKAGVNNVHCPGAYHSSVSLDLPVSIGKYQCSKSPDQPVVVHMTRTPCSPGLSARQQHRAGRLELLNTPFETFERRIRDQLSRMFANHGFDAARDILAITVNRWAHGYAYQYNSLFDPFWLEGGETPCERARKPFGRITIANADAAAYSYTDAAIDQAYRAVNELTLQ